jgi:hypothetical protein
MSGPRGDVPSRATSGPRVRHPKPSTMRYLATVLLSINALHSPGLRMKATACHAPCPAGTNTCHRCTVYCLQAAPCSCTATALLHNHHRPAPHTCACITQLSTPTHNCRRSSLSTAATACVLQALLLQASLPAQALLVGPGRHSSVPC